MTRLFFCQNDVLLEGLFVQRDSLVTLILFELHMPLMIFNPVANFGDHPLLLIQIDSLEFRYDHKKGMNVYAIFFLKIIAESLREY